MAIEVRINHFAHRDQAISEIQASGLRLIEADVAADKLDPQSHAHPYQVDIYVLDGTFELRDMDTGHTHFITAGSKATVPAGANHSEGPSAFRGAFGIAGDPDTGSHRA